MEPAQWIELAKRRLLRTLARRRYASARQLEKKISEAGPADIRPEPMKLYTALRELLQTGAVLQDPVTGLTTFYTPRDFGSPTDQTRKQRILDLYHKFQSFNSNQDLCGFALEAIVDTAANRADRYTVLSPAQRGLRINGVVLERECDHILSPRNFAGPVLMVEDKNMREWLSPSAEEIWSVIGNALRIPNTIPVILCRKLHHVCFTVFSRIGMMGWQLFRQYFHTSIEKDLTDIRHTDGLGFSDITTNTEPPAPLIRFFAKTVPDNAAEFQKRFENQRKLLTEYAIHKKMETRNEIGLETRSYLYSEFFRRLPEPEPRQRTEPPY